MNSSPIRPASRAADGSAARRRRFTGMVAALALIGGGAVAVAPLALAGTTPPAPAIVIDGNVPDAGSTNLPDPEGNVKELGPKNSNSTKIGVIHSAAVPMLDLTNPNGQVDLADAWLKTAKDSDGDDWLYFAWARDANNGSGFISFEFMKNAAPAACSSTDQATLIATCNPWANRKGDPQPGDFLILWDQQGGSKDLFFRQWTGTAPNLTLSPAVQLSSSVAVAQYSADGFRGEAAINLTDILFGGVAQCVSFANIIPSTVTGNSDTADYKDTIFTPGVTISNCAGTTVTTPKLVTDTSTNPDTTTNVPAGGASIGSGVLAVADSAVVSVQGGSPTPTGSVSFALCKVDAPGLCASGGTAVGSTAVTGASYPVTVQSPTAYVTSAGRYCWRATWSGDPANNILPATDATAGECFTVNPVTPQLATTAGADVFLGNAVTDTAAISGLATQPATPVINLTGTAGPAAGGTITFKLYGPSDTGCGALVFTSGTFAVSGNGTYGPASFIPTAPGTYHWVAEYSGNLPNNNATSHNTACTDGNEDVVVNTVTPTVATAQKWVPNDDATITATAGGDLTGSVSFTLYPSTDCTGTAVYGPVSVPIPANAGLSETVSTSNTTAITASGDFSWSVSYDSTNPAQEDVAASCHEVSNLTINNNAP